MVVESTGPQPELVVSSSKPSITDEQKYLPEFDQIAPQIFHYQNSPPASSNVNGSNDPDLIVMCSWMHAQPRHVAKYTDRHRKLFPNSPILLIRQDGGDYTWRPETWQMDAMKSAVDVIDRVKTGKHKNLKVLMHVLSNGGAFTVYQLEKCWNMHHNGVALPIDALLLDSLPGRVSLEIAVKAFSQGLPKNLPTPVQMIAKTGIYGLLLAARLPSYLPGLLYRPDQLSLGRARMNETTSAFTQSQVKMRIYLYSETDELIPWRDVEKHAEDAMTVMGMDRVQLEKFDQSQHVAHALKDPERYWRIVADTWKTVTAASS